MLPRPTSKGFVRISPEQIVQIIVTPDIRQRSHMRGKDDLVGARAELDIRPEERLELRRCRVATVSDPQMERCQAAIRDLPADAHHRHQPELDLMAVRVPVDVDVIESNRGRTIVLAEMQADAVGLRKQRDRRSRQSCRATTSRGIDGSSKCRVKH